VVISARFADIFRGNSGKGGLLAAQVEPSVVDALWAIMDEHPGAEVTIDLENRRVRSGILDEPFEIDDYVRWRLLEGLDDIGITLDHSDAIAEFESRRPEYLPTTK